MATEPITLDLPREEFPDPLPTEEIELLQVFLDYLDESGAVSSFLLHRCVERQSWRLHVPGWGSTGPHRLVLIIFDEDGTATVAGREEADEVLRNHTLYLVLQPH